MTQRLSEIDREYREMESCPVDEKIAYCENLYQRAMQRLEESDLSKNLRDLLNEVIFSTKAELEKLRKDVP